MISKDIKLECPSKFRHEFRGFFYVKLKINATKELIVTLLWQHYYGMQHEVILCFLAFETS